MNFLTQYIQSLKSNEQKLCKEKIHTRKLINAMEIIDLPSEQNVIPSSGNIFPSIKLLGYSP